jgi:hypothetical protein
MSTEPSSPLPSPPPSRSTASIVRQRVGVGLVVLGSAVAFGSLFLQWSHDCPMLPSTISCDPSHWGPPDSGPLVPLPPGNPYALPPAWLPFVLPFPVLGLAVALLLLLRGTVWRRVAVAVGVLVSICGLCSTVDIAKVTLMNDGAPLYRVLDGGGFLSLLGYGTLLLGVLLVVW